MAILKAEQLTKSYRHKPVVNGISMEVQSGEIVGLLGPNGAGKTTCFYMMVGLVSPNLGDVYLDNRNITALPMYARARLGVGYLPQEASIFRKLTVEQNIMAILELRRDLDQTSRLSKLEQLLAEFHISHIRYNRGMSLSGGERRRVEIARALAIEPQFILLDEPFAGIDPISVIDIKRIISHLAQKGIGILITDHNVRETLAICGRAYIVSEGKTIAHGDSKAILANKVVREVYLGEDFDL